MQNLHPKLKKTHSKARDSFSYVVLTVSVMVMIALVIFGGSFKNIVSASSQLAPGDLDMTFGGTGIVTLDIGTGTTADQANGVAVQPDGKVVIAGAASNGSNLDYVVIRYNVDGSLDTTFATGGIGTYAIDARDDWANAVHLLDDGKMLVLGNYRFGTSSSNVTGILKLNADGTRDTTWGTNGLATIFRINNVRGLSILPDGKMMVGGTGPDPSLSSRMTIYRLNANGSIDNSWGSGSNGGEVQLFFPGQTDDFGWDFKVQPDGKAVIAGSSQTGNTPVSQWLESTLTARWIPHSAKTAICVLRVRSVQ